MKTERSVASEEIKRKPREILIANSTPLPNWFFDKVLPIPGLPPSAIRVFLFIWRKTIGWDKTLDYISLTQIQRGACVGRREAVRAAELWDAAGILKRKPFAGKRGMTYYWTNLEADPDEVISAVEAILHLERLKRASPDNW